jgi:ABC-type nitrate/sulfonate/bicarbonate transport system permease component
MREFHAQRRRTQCGRAATKARNISRKGAKHVLSNVEGAAKKLNFRTWRSWRLGAINFLAAGSAFLGLAVLNGLIFSFVLTYAARSIGETYIFTLYGGLTGGGWLWQHIGVTLKVVFYGFVFAVVIGVPLGIALGSSRGWNQIWQPAIQTMYAVPKTMLYPIFIVLFGVGIGSRIAIAFSHAVFPLMIGAMTGAAARAPSLAPALAMAVRTGLSLAVIGVVLSEMYVSTEGLGNLLVVSALARDGAHRVLAIILLLFLGLLLLNVALWALEKRLRARAEPSLIERQ